MSRTSRLALLASFLMTACEGRTESTGGEVAVVPPAAPIPAAEYENRRSRLIQALPDGLTLLHARSEPKSMEEWGFFQDPSFYYFTGLWDLPEAILALDGPAGEAHLMEALTRLLRGRTALLIAHRLPTVMAADQVLVLADGRLIFTEHRQSSDIWMIRADSTE